MGNLFSCACGILSMGSKGIIIIVDYLLNIKKGEDIEYISSYFADSSNRYSAFTRYIYGTILGPNPTIRGVPDCREILSYSIDMRRGYNCVSMI